MLLILAVAMSALPALAQRPTSAQASALRQDGNLEEKSMKRFSARITMIFVALAALLAASVAEAQWVLVARRAVGRVEQMSQQQDNNGASYDSAAVMLEASSDKVFAAVMRGLGNRKDLKITKEDATQGLVQFTNGQQIAGIKVSALGDNLSHLLISSAHSGPQPNAAALVSDSVLRVCKEMNVECSKAQQ